MNKKIRISSNSINIIAELNNSKTAKKIFEGLPFSADASTWGDEIYFTVPIESELENGVEIVEVGTLAYWPPGSAFCIFFGPTPASTGPAPQAASPVTIIGKITDLDDLLLLKKIKNGDMVTLKSFK